MRGLSILPSLKPLRQKSLVIGISVSVHVIWLVWSEPPPSLQLVAQQSEARQFTLPCKGVLYRSAMRLLSRFKYVSEGICILRKVHQTFFVILFRPLVKKNECFTVRLTVSVDLPPYGQLFVNFLGVILTWYYNYMCSETDFTQEKINFHATTENPNSSSYCCSSHSGWIFLK